MSGGVHMETDRGDRDVTKTEKRHTDRTDREIGRQRETGRR